MATLARSRRAAPGGSALLVGRRRVPVSNLDKVLYPATGFTKGDLIRYYADIAPVLLPHLRGRALTLKRYPDGVAGFFFYEKRCPPGHPPWVRTADVFSERLNEAVPYCLADDLPTLVWVANLADIELHPSLALARAQSRPTMMVFDLDPGEGAALAQCARVALWLREKLQLAGLESWPKTSGSKGIQTYVPLNVPSVDFELTKAASREVAESVERDQPRVVVTNMRKELRRGKVLIDWSQNSAHKTTVCAYSLRATPEPSVSTPLDWDEVEGLAASRSKSAGRFSPAQALERVRERGDLFEPVLKKKQRLPR